MKYTLYFTLGLIAIYLIYEIYDYFSSKMYKKHHPPSKVGNDFYSSERNSDSGDNPFSD